MLEDNGKQSPEEPYQKYVVGGYVYKSVCVDDKFSKSFKSYLVKI